MGSAIEPQGRPLISMMTVGPCPACLYSTMARPWNPMARINWPLRSAKWSSSGIDLRQLPAEPRGSTFADALPGKGHVDTVGRGKAGKADALARNEFLDEHGT